VRGDGGDVGVQRGVRGAALLAEARAVACLVGFAARVARVDTLRPDVRAAALGGIELVEVVQFLVQVVCAEVRGEELAVAHEARLDPGVGVALGVVETGSGVARVVKATHVLSARRIIVEGS
jgi:hypothetical protein